MWQNPFGERAGFGRPTKAVPFVSRTKEKGVQLAAKWPTNKRVIHFTFFSVKSKALEILLHARIKRIWGEGEGPKCWRALKNVLTSPLGPFPSTRFGLEETQGKKREDKEFKDQIYFISIH